MNPTLSILIPRRPTNDAAITKQAILLCRTIVRSNCSGSIKSSRQCSNSCADYRSDSGTCRDHLKLPIFFVDRRSEWNYLQLLNYLGYLERRRLAASTATFPYPPSSISRALEPSLSIKVSRNIFPVTAIEIISSSSSSVTDSSG
jgi:hypothetical protein